MSAAAGRMPERVLVTGAAGFIGPAVCQRLLAAGSRVFAYDNLSRGRRDHLSADVVLFAGDIRDRARVAHALSAARPDAVIHLAALHFIPDCIARPDETRDVNVEGTRGLLEACGKALVRHVVFASTAAVYAPSEDPCTEDGTPLGPLEIYGESKLLGEGLVNEFHRATGIATTVMRLFNAVGRHETNPHVIPHIFESVKRSDVIPLGNVEPRRDYIDTRDIADALAAVLSTAEGARTLNVGTGSAYSVTDVVDRLSRILGRPLTIEQESARTRTTERMVLVANMEHTRRTAHWSPRITFDATLRDLIEAYDLRATTMQGSLNP